MTVQLHRFADVLPVKRTVPTLSCHHIPEFDPNYNYAESSYLYGFMWQLPLADGSFSLYSKEYNQSKMEVELILSASCQGIHWRQQNQGNG